MDTVGQRIVKARDLKGWSRPRLAEESGIPYPTLAGLENGDQQTSSWIPAIAAATGVDALWLASGEGKMLPSAVQQSASQSAQLDLGKLAQAQKFLEDVFSGEEVRFVASEQTLLLAAVYEELMTEVEPNLVEMTTRYSKKIRGKSERQGAAGSAIAHDRERVGEGGKPARAKARRIG